MKCDKCQKNTRRLKLTSIEGKLSWLCGECRAAENTEVKGMTITGLKPQPVAYFRDEKTGQRFPVDRKGNIIDRDPYYAKGDPRGWRRAGKSTEGYKRTVHMKEDLTSLEIKRHE